MTGCVTGWLTAAYLVGVGLVAEVGEPPRAAAPRAVRAGDVHQPVQERGSAALRHTGRIPLTSVSNLRV
eukprot:3275210-Pyramimonas_sp.AAC.1